MKNNVKRKLNFLDHDSIQVEVKHTYNLLLQKIIQNNLRQGEHSDKSITILTTDTYNPINNNKTDDSFKMNKSNNKKRLLRYSNNLRVKNNYEITEEIDKRKLNLLKIYSKKQDRGNYFACNKNTKKESSSPSNFNLDIKRQPYNYQHHNNHFNKDEKNPMSKSQSDKQRENKSKKRKEYALPEISLKKDKITHRSCEVFSNYISHVEKNFLSNENRRYDEEYYSHLLEKSKIPINVYIEQKSY